jgi:hypothetical protein
MRHDADWEKGSPRARTPPLPMSTLTGPLLTATPLFSVVPRHCFFSTGHVRSAPGRARGLAGQHAQQRA